jgi:hypothetical protein
MKLLAVLTVLLLLVGSAQAAPFLGCDAYPAEGAKPTYYIITGAAWIPAIVPAQADGSIKMDVAQAAPGITPLVVKACMSDPTWGEVCSTTVPFDLVRPSPLLSPRNIKLTK